MLNHFALVSPLSPNSILSLCHGKLPKVVLAFITLNREGGVGGGGGGVAEGRVIKFVLSMWINFAILAGARGAGSNMKRRGQPFRKGIYS